MRKRSDSKSMIVENQSRGNQYNSSDRAMVAMTLQKGTKKAVYLKRKRVTMTSSVNFFICFRSCIAGSVIRRYVKCMLHADVNIVVEWTLLRFA